MDPWCNIIGSSQCQLSTIWTILCDLNLAISIPTWRHIFHINKLEIFKYFRVTRGKERVSNWQTTDPAVRIKRNIWRNRKFKHTWFSMTNKNIQRAKVILLISYMIAHYNYDIVLFFYLYYIIKGIIKIIIAVSSNF